MSNPKCDPRFLEDFQKKAKKESYDTDKLREVERRVRKLHAMATKTRNQYSDGIKQANAQAKASMEHLFAQEMGELFDLKGVNYNAIDAFMANSLNQKSKAFGLSPSNRFTNTGEVRANMLEMRRLARGFIDEVARYSGMKKVREHTKNVHRILKKHGIRDAKIRNQLLIDTIEIGQYPKTKAVYGIGAAGQAVLEQNYQAFQQRLVDLGLSLDEIDSMVSSAVDISAIMDEVRMMANGLGLDVGKVDGIGYITRVFTPEVSRYIDAAKRKGQVFSELLSDGQGFSLSTNIAESRKTNFFIPEDRMVVSELLGIEVDKLDEMLTNKTFTKYLYENVSADTLDELVDTGIMSKIPMTTKEVYEYMITQYKDLPFKGMDDIFRTDPEEIVDFYIGNLQQATEMSSVTKGIVSDGVKQGWAVTEELMRQNPDLYKNFKKLSAQDIKRYYPGYKGTQPVFMHPIVADTWTSILKVSGDPRFMNVFSQHVNYWGSLLSSSMLIHPAYAARILWDSARSMISAGGNFFRSFEGYFDIVRLYNGSKGFDFLDNTKKIYKGIDGNLITEQELMRQFVRHRGGSLVPHTSNMRLGRGMKDFSDFFDIKQMGRSVNYTFAYMKAFGGVEASKYIADGLKGKQRQLLAPIAALANFFEVGAKWATIKSLADTRVANTTGQVLSSFAVAPKFDNLRDLFRHVDDYFLAWDDIGTTTNLVGNVFRPFAAYAMSNPPAQVRQAMRRPREFVNYYRVKSFMMGGSDVNDEDLTEATVPDWMLKNNPVYFKKDSDGNFVTLLSRSWDARGDAFTFIHEGGEALARDYGWYVGTTPEQREKIMNDYNGRSGLSLFFADMMSQSHELWKGVIELSTGYDFETRRTIEKKSLDQRDSFLGFYMPSLARYALASYPPLSRLDRANPGNIFGTPEIRDPVTGEVELEGQPSFAGAKRDDGNRIERYLPGQHERLIRIGQVMGLDFRIIDVARNLQWSMNDIDRSISEMKAGLGKTRVELTKQMLKGNTDDPEFQRRVQEYNEQVEKFVYLNYDLIRLVDYANDKGIPPSRVLEEVENDAVRKYIELGGRTPVDEGLRKALEKADGLFLEIKE